MRTWLRILALVVVLAALVLGAVVLHRSFALPMRPRPAPEPSAAADSGGEDVVARALRLAGRDTTRARAHKDEWVDDIPDLDLTALTPRAREAFVRIANGRRCTCGCGYTLAGCRRYDAMCDVSGPRAAALYDSVKAGRITRADAYPARPARR